MEQLPILELVIPAALGIGLAAASGFRIFIPLLITGMAVRAGYIPVSENFDWVASTPALVMLSIAAIVEILAYYVPGLDNLLDTVATPLAIVSGVAISAAVMTDLPPMLKWTLAIIAGGGAASVTQSATTLLRGGSTLTTAGLGNSVIATGEFLGAVAISVLTIFAPWIGLVVALALCALIYSAVRRYRKRRRSNAA